VSRSPTASSRSTEQRRAIRRAVERAGRPLLPEEVLAAAQGEVPRLGIATVYRNLKALVEAAELRVVELPGDASRRYEPAALAHHHHFRCTRCERVFDVAHCPGDLKRLAPAGFVVEAHDLLLLGRCLDCAGPAGP
jgi:Fur family ferric uptake transcriptional regulator